MTEQTVHLCVQLKTIQLGREPVNMGTSRQHSKKGDWFGIGKSMAKCLMCCCVLSLKFINFTMIEILTTHQRSLSLTQIEMYLWSWHMEKPGLLRENQSVQPGDRKP